MLLKIHWPDKNIVAANCHEVESYVIKNLSKRLKCFSRRCTDEVFIRANHMKGFLIWNNDGI